MGIDVNWLRPDKGGNPDEFRDSEKRRFRDPKLIDEVQAADKAWIQSQHALELNRADQNRIQKEVGAKKKADKNAPCEEEKTKLDNLKKEAIEQQEKAEAAATTAKALLHKVGNLVHPSVPVFDDEAHNAVITKWGTPWIWQQNSDPKAPSLPGQLKHHEVLSKLRAFEPKKGSVVAGHRGYYLRTVGVLLNQALINYGLAFLMRKGYDLLQPPYFMKKEIMAKTAELNDFEETLYKIPGEQSGAKAEDGTPDSFLIATSEQPISAYHMNDWMHPETLPLRYGGVSTCFRKEAGSHGKEAQGIFRVHQFEKVEQFCITNPEESYKMHDEMLATSEEFYQSLGLPYRVVAIVSGGLNDAAAKKYDLEAWFPSFNDYRELVSCSNCTDYQSRELEIRYGQKKQNENIKKYVHMLNGTLCATQRCMSCLVENYQTLSGVKVPRVLVPFMGGMEFIPYPEEEVSASAEKK